MMNRRDVLVVGTSAVAASITSVLVACAEKKKSAPEVATGSAPPGAALSEALQKGPNRHPELAAAASHCLTTGDACLAHCLESLATGDKMLGDCAVSTHQMLAVCHMIGTLAASDSPHLTKAAALCDSVCKDCKIACDKHAAMHAECKACADACGEMIAQLAKLL